MSEDLSVVKGTKEDQYKSLLPQIKALIDGETDLIANLGNITSALKEQFGWLWVGFYLVNNGELVLGPFQGPIACTRIQKGKGVCGAAWEQKKTLIVPDVNKFSGHIFCSSSSLSEIVIPVIKENAVAGVLDVDSASYNSFDETDERFLKEIAGWVKEML